MTNAPAAATKPSPLGRGLSALFGDADASYQPAAATRGNPAHAESAITVASKTGAIMQQMPIGWLRSGRFQPRHHFDEAALAELAASIRERGILEPLLVRALPNARDSYEIIAGERRWRAAQLAGMHNVPVWIRNLTDREALEFGIIENVQREDLSPLEEGEGYKRLLEEFGHSQEALSKIVGKSRPHITNTIRLLSLPEGVRQMIADGKLTSAHARALIPARNPLALAQEIVRKGLNSRQAELLAKKDQDNPETHKRRPNALNADALALEKELERVIGLKVKITARGQSGMITLHYTNLDQMDDIIKKLSAK